MHVRTAVKEARAQLGSAGWLASPRRPRRARETPATLRGSGRGGPKCCCIRHQEPCAPTPASPWLLGSNTFTRRGWCCAFHSGNSGNEMAQSLSVTALQKVARGLAAENQVRSCSDTPLQLRRGSHCVGQRGRAQSPSAVEVVAAAQTWLMNPQNPVPNPLFHLSTACLTGISDSKCPRRKSRSSPPPATMCPSRDLPQPG